MPDIEIEIEDFDDRDDVDVAPISKGYEVHSDGKTLRAKITVTDNAANRALATGNGWLIRDDQGTEIAPKIRHYMRKKDLKKPIDVIDYRRGLKVRLQPLSILLNGNIDRVLFFAPEDVTIDPGTGQWTVGAATIPVLEEKRGYVDGGMGPAVRTMTINWFADDGTVYATKTTTKSYTPNIAALAANAYVGFNPATERMLDQGISAGTARRRNVLSEIAQFCFLGIMAEAQIANPLAEIQAFNGAHKTAAELFVSGADPSIAASISVDTRTWLDVGIAAFGGATARALIAGALSSWVV